MSNSDSAAHYGSALYEYLEQFWRAEGVAMTRWCLDHGIPPGQLTRWRDGQEPGVASLRRVADAVERPILDVLIATGVVSRGEASGRTPVPPAQRPTLDDVLRAEGLPDEGVTAVLNLVELVRQKGRRR